jgi:hypothetical protein
MGVVVGVVGGSGGVGASSFAAALAVQAGAVLVDVDVSGGGADVLLGVELVPGARWSGLRLAGGRLDPAALLAGLPRWGPSSVLAADVPEIDPEAVLQVVDVAAGVGPVVLDLPRVGGPERAAGLLRCDLVLVLVRNDVTGLVAAHAVLSALPELPVGAVVRRGAIPAGEVADRIGARLLGELPPGGPGFPLDPARLPRAVQAVAAGVLAGLGAPV